MKRREYCPEDLRRRFSFLVAVALGGFLLLVARLWHLQVIQGNDLRHLSENNRIRLVRISAPRGLITDRLGRILVDNRPAFNISVIPKEIGDWQVLSFQLWKILNIPPEDLRAILSEVRQRPKFLPVKIKRDITWEELARLEENKFYLPGILIDVESRRLYPHGALAAHVLGTIGEITLQQLRDTRHARYNVGDVVGRGGIELQFEKYFKGRDGGRQVEVTAAGREIRVLNEVGASAGSTVQLTIDGELQAWVEKVFEHRAGAVVVMDPRSGAVLAMMSRPTFDPNTFAGCISAQQWKEIASDPLHPLENRAIRGQYPPGSIFKIVTALAGLAEGKIGPRDELYCPGYYSFGNYVHRCWKRGGHGSISLHRAMVESCDVYFYQLGQRVGIDRLAHYARMLGLGAATGIDLMGESAGLVPDSRWKKQTLGESWYPGETISVSVGQGYLLATPLQMAVLTSAVANGGILYRPLIVEKVVSPDGGIVATSQPQGKRREELPLTHLSLIRNALRGVVHEPHGTGAAARIPGLEIGGKTGTSQVSRLGGRPAGGAQNAIPYHLRDHAWFVCFAPMDKPEVVVVVLVEHGGFGGSVAAPVARQILEKYFSLKRERPHEQKIVAQF